jgi:alpha-aminoadipate/glutamate carrier protein LysW
MVVCPECSSAIDVDEEDIDEGETLSCDECGAALKVVSTNPLEIEAAEEREEEDEEDDDLLDDEDEEEEEESEEDWR